MYKSIVSIFGSLRRTGIDGRSEKEKGQKNKEFHHLFSFSVFLSVLLSSLIGIIIVSVSFIGSASAVSYPSTTPPSETAGGLYNTYFYNMYSGATTATILSNPTNPTIGCPYGQAVRGFTATGILLCTSNTNAAASLTGAIAGSDKVNYIPKWAGANGELLAKSVMYESGGKIGVGTINPVSPLEVAGLTYDTSSPGYASIATFEKFPTFNPGAGGSAAHINLSQNDQVLAQLGTLGSFNNGIFSSHFFYIDVDKSNSSGWVNPAFVIRDSGNVGIGTTNPTEKLQVKDGSINVGGSGGFIHVGYDTADSSLGKIAMHHSSVSNASQNFVGMVYSNTAGWLRIGGNRALNLFIDAGEAPGYNNHIFRKVGWDGTAPTYTESMRITGSGNVGIGTTTPRTKLEVNQNSNTDYTQIIQNGGGNGLGLHIRAGSVGGGQSGASLNVTSWNGAMDKFWVGNDGNVGIGTSTPQVKLEVNGDINVGINTGSASPVGPGNKLSFLGQSNNTDPLYMYRYNSGFNNSELRMVITDDSTNTDLFSIGTTSDYTGVNPNFANMYFPKFTFLSNGNMGIGNTNPQGNLHVGKASNQTVDQYFLGATTLGEKGIRIHYNNFSSDPTNYEHAVIDARAKMFSIRGVAPSVTGDASIERLNVDLTTGNVGIGTEMVSPPRAKLDVRGAAFLGSTDMNKGIKFTDGWSSYPDTTLGSEISNDTTNYKTLMIIGNRSNNGSTRRVSIWDELNVNGTTNANGPLNVGGATTLNNSLTVNGITNLNNNVYINSGNLIMSGGTIAFTDPAQIPWVPKGANLPFFKFGGLKYIKPQIFGSFNGQIIPFSGRSYLFFEPTGMLVGLRNGYNGEYYAMYYMYNEKGDYTKMAVTNMEYKPAFLDGKDEHVSWMFDGNESSMSIQTVTSTGAARYYLITRISTLDPATHTPDKVISLDGLPSVSCIWVSAKDLVACTDGDNIQRLFLYQVNADKTLTKLTLTNSIKGGVATDTFFDSTDTTYFIKTGPFTSYNWIGDHTQNPNIQYHYDSLSNTLYLQTIRSAYASAGANGERIVTYNLIYRINLSTYSVGYENTFPLKYNWSTDSSESVDLYSLFTTSGHYYGINYKPYFFKQSNRVYPVLKGGDDSLSTAIGLYSTNIPNMLAYMKSLRGSSIGININGGNVGPAWASHMSYDPSTLGKQLAFTRFLGEKAITTVSFAYIYGKSYPNPTTYWVKLTIPSTSFSGFLDGTPRVPLPTKIDNITDVRPDGQHELQKIKNIRVDGAGKMIGYFLDTGGGGQIFRYDETIQTAPSLYLTIPTSYKNTIGSGILATPGYNDPLYGAPLNIGTPTIRIISDNLLIVPYNLVYRVDPSTQTFKFVSHYLLYRYNSSGLTLLQRATAYNSTNISGLNSITQDFTDYVVSMSASYIASDGTIYLYFVPNYAGWNGGGGWGGAVLKIAAGGSSLLASSVSNGGCATSCAWQNAGIGIHPLYGIYKSTSFEYSRSRSYMYFYDKRSIANLDARMKASFDAYLNGEGQTAAVMATVRQAEGFTVYTSDTPIFIDGTQAMLTTDSYDLTDSKYGLVATSGNTVPLQNRIIYAYIDPNSPAAQPKLAFSFDEPVTPVIAVISTKVDGIDSILVRDGLNLTVDTIYVKKINVTNQIEMRGANGKLYRIYIDAAGGLKVDLCGINGC